MTHRSNETNETSLIPITKSHQKYGLENTQIYTQQCWLEKSYGDRRFIWIGREPLYLQKIFTNLLGLNEMLFGIQL